MSVTTNNDFAKNADKLQRGHFVHKATFENLAREL